MGEKIAGKWKKLGRRLDINDPKLQQIHEEHDQLSERGYHMLKHWKQEKGSAATYQALSDALKHNLVQRQDLTEQFCYIHGNYFILGGHNFHLKGTGIHALLLRGSLISCRVLRTKHQYFLHSRSPS